MDLSGLGGMPVDDGPMETAAALKPHLSADSSTEP
jgi:hypothetical protein